MECLSLSSHTGVTLVHDLAHYVLFMIISWFMGLQVYCAYMRIEITLLVANCSCNCYKTNAIALSLVDMEFWHCADSCKCLCCTELRVESSSVIRGATLVCPDVAVQLITQSIDDQIKQAAQPQQSGMLTACVFYEPLQFTFLFILSSVSMISQF